MRQVKEKIVSLGICIVMMLIDTPGTDSSSEAYKHAILLREGLTATEINTISSLLNMMVDLKI